MASRSEVLSVPVINSFSCVGPVEETVWPRNTFRYTCFVDLADISGNGNFKLGIYTNNYDTLAISGNGDNLDFRDPENSVYRFRADGPEQSGNSENITTFNTGSSATILRRDITQDVNFTFDLLYTTYEADYGGTIYNQGFTVALYKDDGTPVSSVNDNLTFTIRDRHFISISAPPSVTLTSSNQVFTLNQYYDSNAFTVYVAANNTWKLQASLTDNLVSVSNAILPVDDNYYKCSGTGFDNFAPDYVQFLVPDTFYDVAQNSPGEYTTGSIDRMNLQSAAITLNYSFKNTKIYKAGVCSTTTIFKLVSPN